MRKGRSGQHSQHPPHGYKHSPNWLGHARSARERYLRHTSVGANLRYSYTEGMNMCIFTGRVSRWPKPAGLKGKEMVWFRIAVPNQDNRGQWLFLPVRCSGALAAFVYANIRKGDVVSVVGRLYSGKWWAFQGEDAPEKWKHIFFQYLIAEKVAGSHPVIADQDRRYVKVRVDLFNRLCSLSQETNYMRVPEEALQELNVKDVPEGEDWYAQVEDEVEQDQPDSDFLKSEDDDDASDDGKPGLDGGG